MSDKHEVVEVSWRTFRAELAEIISRISYGETRYRVMRRGRPVLELGPESRPKLNAPGNGFGASEKAKTLPQQAA